MKKLTKRDCQKIAASHGGTFCSKQYINIRTRYKWKCSFGHTWFAVLKNIRSKNSWCPQCSNHVAHTLDDCIKHAKLRGGQCLSKTYKNNKTNIKWRCSKNHTWFANFHNMLNTNCWCKICAGHPRRTLKDAKALAIKHGGKCLSKTFKTVDDNLLWECDKKHTWIATYASIKKESWCPVCNKRPGKTQQKLFNIVKALFPKYKISYNFRDFSWLKTNKNGRMEIDIYVHSIRLATEYDGRQHFVPSCFGEYSETKAKRNLREQKSRDAIKNKKIKRHKQDIKYFIRFSYKEKLSKEYVALRLTELGIKV